MSNESGRFEVYVQPFPRPGGKWQISNDGGMSPVWAPNGGELFYITSTRLMRVAVTTRPGFSASAPQRLAELGPGLLNRVGLGSYSYDVSPDGQRFLFVEANMKSGSPDEVRVVLNWTEELKQLTPTSTQP